MIMNRAATLGLALSLFALAVGGDPFLPSRFPFGSYDSDAYTLTFDTTGTFRYVKGDQLMVQGKYVVHDSTVAVTDERGVDACVGRQSEPWARIAGNSSAVRCGSTPSTTPAQIEFAASRTKRGGRTGFTEFTYANRRLHSAISSGPSATRTVNLTNAEADKGSCLSFVDTST